MDVFYPFFIVIFAAVFFSMLFRRLHFPWVIAMIFGGMLLGPYGFKVFETNTTIDFLAQMGLVFLMFMAGLETKFSTFKVYKKNVFTIAVFNGLLPFFAAVVLAQLFGYSWSASLLLGIIFISSSIAVIIPSLESNKLAETRIGRSIVAATVLEDVSSLVFLSLFLQVVDKTARLPLPIFYLLLFFSLVLIRWLLPKVRWVFLAGQKEEEADPFQQEFRSVLFVLLGTVLVFEFLGLHPIIAGFFAGLVLSESIKSETLKEKLRTVSYGIFIPVFFVVVGTKTDIGVFIESKSSLFLTISVVLVSVFSKYISGTIAGKILKFTSRQSSLIGAATIPQLSTTLAVVFTGVEMGILDNALATAMVVLSVVTVFIAPILIKSINSKLVHYQ